MGCRGVLMCVYGFAGGGEVFICCGDAFQEVQVVEVGYDKFRSIRMRTVVGVFFSASERITPFVGF